MARGTVTFNHSAQQLLRTLKKHKFRAALRSAVEREQAELERDGRRQQLTAAEYFALRSQVRADVEAYLLEHGPEGLDDTIIAKWTGEATKRCLEQMVGAIVDAPPSPEALAAARERIEKRLNGRPTMRQAEARAKGVEYIAAQIPAAPPPAFIARNGIKQLEKLDIFEELTVLFNDARLLRASSVRADERTGGERVTNPRTFDRSISRRLEILATSIATQKELWDLQRMEAFYTTIIETIASAAPEVAQEIQRRLAALHIHVGAV